MTAQDVLTWFEIPESDADRAQRFYDILIEIAASGDPCRAPAAGVRRRCDLVAAPARAAAPAGGQEA